MGLLKLLRKLRGSDKEARILLLGLDNAGKTHTLQKLSEEKPANLQPTQGFNIKSVAQSGFKLNMWDIGGQKAIRPYWRNYYEGTDVLIWVVDANDDGRFEEARAELDQLMKEPKLAKVPMLVLANKSDLLSAKDEDEVSIAMKLTSIKDRKVKCLSVSAKTGDGLQDAIGWAINIVEKK